MSKLDSAQLGQLREIGAYLYQARQEQSKPLEEVAAVTFIPLRLLKAIEAGQDEVLPEAVFIQGFIRRYADVLGLDGMVLARQFSISPSPAVPQSSAAVVVKSVPRKRQLSPAVTSDDRPHQPQASPGASTSGDRRQFPYAGSRQFLYAASIVLGIAVVGGLVYEVSHQFRNQKSQQSQPSQPGGTAGSGISAPSPPMAQTSPSVAPQPSVAPPPATTAPIQVDLVLTGASWLQITVDGQKTFEGILQQGEQRRLTAQTNLTVLAGNAGAVSLALNGGSAQPMGSAGAVERRTFTPNTPEASQ